jgi:hypothetical protein
MSLDYNEVTPAALKRQHNLEHVDAVAGSQYIAMSIP